MDLLSERTEGLNIEGRDIKPDSGLRRVPVIPVISINDESGENEEQQEKLFSQADTDNENDDDINQRLKSDKENTLSNNKGLLLTTWTKSTVNGKEDECKIKEQFISEDTNSKNNTTVGTAATTNSTPWERILQCFNVFKPKKVSTTDFEVKNLGTLKKSMTESDFSLYELSTKSEILDCQDTMKIGKYLPARAIGCTWDLTFSTTHDGCSLHSLYRKMDNIDSPVWLVILDSNERVFGAILSCAFRVSDTFYGNSDTFLYRCRPNFEVFKWSGDNFYFIQGQDDFISVGSDGGKSGLWLDDNLYMGRTEECCTFRSPALVEEKDFKINTVECWTVGKLC